MNWLDFEGGGQSQGHSEVRYLNELLLWADAHISTPVLRNIGMRAAYSFKHPLFSDSVEFCGWVCLSVRTVFQNASSPSFLVRLS